MPSFKIDLSKWFEDNSNQIDRNLRRYFDGNAGDLFSGRWFDRFAEIGDPNRFEASDIVAIEALSVRVPSEAASRLLITDSERFNKLLQGIPRDMDLWTVDRQQISVGSAAYDLHAALKKELPKVGPVTAGKLIAAKRPRMIPIFDTRVDRLLGAPDGFFWVSMYDELIADDRRRAIENVCRNAPSHVSLLRRIDVALWMAAAP